MIFKSVNELSNKSEKRFFLELIEVFTRLIDVYCEKNNIKNYEDIILDSDDLKELKKIGVIKKSSEVSELKKVLKGNYGPFIKAVKFSKNNNELVHDTIYKLYKSERKRMQEASNKKQDLTLIIKNMNLHSL